MFKLKKHQQKLSVKIGIGFGLVALVLIGTITFTLIKINQTDHINQKLYAQITPQMTEAMRIINGLNSVISDEKDWLINQDKKYQIQRDAAWQQKITPSLNALLSLKDSRNENYINQIHDSLDTLYKTIKQSDKNQELEQKKRITYFYENVYPIANNADYLIKNFIHEKESFLLAGLQNVKKQMIHMLIMDAGFLILGLILCILLGIVLTNLITKPIKNLVNMTDEIAKGNLNQKINLSEAYEFEQLSHSINRVVETLNDIADVNVKMSEGDYNHQVKIKSKNDKLAISTNRMLDNFSAIVNQANAIVNGDYSSEITPRSAHDKLGIALQNMTSALRDNKEYNDEQNWLKDGLAQFANIISDARDLKKLCDDSLSAICRYSEAGMGAIYLLNRDTNKLILQGSYAFTERNHLANIYDIGQGLIGQVAYENKAIQLKGSQDPSHRIDTGLINQSASIIYAFPLVYEKNLIGVCELAWMSTPNKLVRLYLESLSPMLSSHIQATQQQILTESLLQEQKNLANKLGTQQEELKATNEELEHQTQILKASEEELRIKDEEQRKINHQLEERTKELELQKTRMQEANKALESAKYELENKADELSKASKYKSEFLANMSHELRTPLNSLLILAKIFADNSDKNLSEEQIESAKIMLKSGQDLLTLINDILDLAKVESGKMEVHFSEMNLQQMVNHLNSTFSVIAKDKAIEFIAEVTDNVPEYIVTDEQRVTQIIRNLLSNAIKFTNEGYVKLKVYIPHRESELLKENFNITEYVAIAVSDTGIGISQEKQTMVFDSFQQEDGTTSRKYGGTGLGLSISKEFSKLLKGHIRLTSEQGKGSTFILYLPLNLKSNHTQVILKSAKQIPSQDSNRLELKSENKSSEPKKNNLKLRKLLIIEDDTNFANTLMTLCRKKGYMCRHVISAEDSLKVLEKDIPDVILLDINLPGMNGIELLDKLKKNKRTAQVPVQIISASDENTASTKKGAIGYLTKPITHEQLDEALDAIESKINSDIKNLLIIEDNSNLATQIKKIILKNDADINIDISLTGKHALNLLKDNSYDCIILDLGLPDMTGLEVIHQYHAININQNPSVIIYTGQELNNDDTQNLSQYADSIIIKGGEASIERLLQETTAFLDKTTNIQKHTTSLPTQQLPETSNLADKKILLVDDDSRNVFAIKKILTQITSHIITASDGKQALEVLQKEQSIDLILMDIMMPIMDGYETTAAIRKKSEYQTVPIIALTAKALSGDKQKCLDAGANDYVTKPIDMDILIKKVQKWLTTKL